MERTRRPTLDTVAREVGVSRATVSNAYNRPDQLSAELREKILEAAGRLGYAGPDPVARSLATRRSASVAFMTATGTSIAFSDPVLSLVLDGLASALDSRDHALVLLPGSGEGPRPERLARVQADLVIAYGLPDDSPAVTAVHRRGLPLIVVDQPADGRAARIEIDDRGGAAAAARHVTGLGHRTVGVLALPLGPDGHTGEADARRRATARYRIARDRLGGYADALAAAGLAADRVPVWESPRSSRELGRAGARWLLDRAPRPTALLCMSDELAVGALEAAKDLGLSVPADVSVVGYDDTPAASWASPQLTTVHQPLTDKGRQLGILALSLLEDPDAPLPVQILNAHLVERASTTLAPASATQLP